MPVAHRQFKDHLYEQFARIGKATSSPKRLELLDLLAQGPRTVEALAEQASIPVANASQHLKVLREANLVVAEKKGLYVEYRVASDRVSEFYLALRGLAESRLAEVERLACDYFEQRGPMEPVASEELLRRVQDGEVTVIDVRPVEEYRARHIKGAISIPLAQLKSRLAELPKRRAIVAYCRGPYCVMAIEAVELLRKKGYAAHRMDQGPAEWRAAGGRVESQGASR